LIKYLKIFLVIFLLITIYPKCFAQQRLFINALNNLSFGQVYIGYSKDLPHSDVNAAKISFYQSFGNRRTLLVNLSLPSNLVNGSNTIPLTFDLNHTAYSKTDQLSGRTLFNPYSTLNISNVNKNTPYYVWIGAILGAKSDIPSGTYTGTIIVTVALY
jgi:hypothetical protein